MDYSDFENQNPIMAAAPATQANSKDMIDESFNIASKFCHYFYEMLEKKPHLVGKLYLENSVLQWDGNAVVTREGIQKFIETLPSLTFNLSAMDCQSISSAAVGNKKSFIIKTSGQYRVSGVGSVKPFSQQMVITADNDKWRIATDNFRSQ